MHRQDTPPPPYSEYALESKPMPSNAATKVSGRDPRTSDSEYAFAFDLRFNFSRIYCNTDKREQWVSLVMDVISKHPYFYRGDQGGFIGSERHRKADEVIVHVRIKKPFTLAQMCVADVASEKLMFQMGLKKSSMIIGRTVMVPRHRWSAPGLRQGYGDTPYHWDELLEKWVPGEAPKLSSTGEEKDNSNNDGGRTNTH